MSVNGTVPEVDSELVATAIQLTDWTGQIDNRFSISFYDLVLNIAPCLIAKKGTKHNILYTFSVH